MIAVSDIFPDIKRIAYGANDYQLNLKNYHPDDAPCKISGRIDDGISLQQQLNQMMSVFYTLLHCSRYHPFPLLSFKHFYIFQCLDITPGQVCPFIFILLITEAQYKQSSFILKGIALDLMLLVEVSSLSQSGFRFLFVGVYGLV